MSPSPELLDIDVGDATADTDPRRNWMDFGRGSRSYAEEIVQYLIGLIGMMVEITTEIHADFAEGAGDKLERDITENCRTLKFTDYGFDEE